MTPTPLWELRLQKTTNLFLVIQEFLVRRDEVGAENSQGSLVSEYRAAWIERSVRP